MQPDCCIDATDMDGEVSTVEMKTAASLSSSFALTEAER